jgi:hypothetical protein
MQVGRESWECARCGCSKSFEWQTSVGHIACLRRRTVERPVGGKTGALARQKLEAFLTRGTGRQKAKRYAVARFLTVSRSRLADLGLQALEHDGRRSWTIGRQAFTGRAIRSPQARRSNASASSSRKGAWRRASGSGGTDTDSDVPTSDQESVRGRHGSVKAPRGTEKVQGEFVSSALKRRRTKKRYAGIVNG